MARERNPERDKARRIWLDSGGTLTARQVAEQVGVKPEQVRKWKSLDSWAAELEAQKPPRKRGGQGKTVNGTYTVKYYYPGRKCGVHIDGLGWVPESGCTVIG